MSEPRVVFGLVAPPNADELAAKVDRLTKRVAQDAGIEVERADAASYEALAEQVRESKVDVAWLPPIVFVRLEAAARPLASVLRGGRTSYEAALVIRADSPIKTIEELRGTRAGWVDRWSAAGFVLPRAKLALLGIDPRTVFRTETFYGSHKAAIRALIDGACDVAGTYARANADPKSARDKSTMTGSWSEVAGAEVRVLATFGAIPPDVIAVRAGLPEEIGKRVTSALRKAASEEDGREMLRDVFGGDDIHEGPAPGYDALGSALAVASERGLFD